MQRAKSSMPSSPFCSPSPGSAWLRLPARAGMRSDVIKEAKQLVTHHGILEYTGQSTAR
jgi:hypothetical protein